MRHLKIIGVCVVVSAVAETVIYHYSYQRYVETITFALMIGWGIGSLVLAWFEPRSRYLYWGSVSLAAPGIAYDMLGHGPLVMGGVFHALVTGVYAIPFWYWFQGIRKRRLERIPEPITGANALGPSARMEKFEAPSINEMREWGLKLKGKTLEEIVGILGPPARVIPPSIVPAEQKKNYKSKDIMRGFEFRRISPSIETLQARQLEDGKVEITFRGKPQANND